MLAAVRRPRTSTPSGTTRPQANRSFWRIGNVACTGCGATSTKPFSTRFPRVAPGLAADTAHAAPFKWTLHPPQWVHGHPKGAALGLCQSARPANGGIHIHCVCSALTVLFAAYSLGGPDVPDNLQDDVRARYRRSGARLHLRCHRGCL